MQTRIGLSKQKDVDRAVLPVTNLFTDLTIWDEPTFPIQVPDSSFTGDGPVVAFSNLFQKPVSDELRELAVDADGNRKKLNAEQKKDVRQTGAFNVPSAHNHGEHHRWQLSSWLQKGIKTTNEEFLNDLAFSAERFCIRIPRRIFSDDSQMTIWDGIVNAVKSISDVPVLLIGWSSTKQKHTDSEIEKMMEEYQLEKLIEMIIKDQISKIDDSYVFQVGNFTVRFPLLNHEASGFSNFTVAYSSFMLNWNHQSFERRRDIAHQFEGQEDVSQKVADREQEILQDHIFNMVQTTMEKEDAEVMIDLLSTVRQIKLETKRRDNLFQGDLKNYLDSQKIWHPILSRRPVWIESTIAEFTKKWYLDHPESQIFDVVLHNLNRNSQTRFMLEMNRNIERSQGTCNLNNELHKQVASREYSWIFQRWHPYFWKIRKTDSGQYYAEKSLRLTTNTNWPLWRLVNGLMRIGVATNNCMWWGSWNLWNGPVGLRSLWGIEDFMTWQDVDPQTGKIVDCLSCSTWFGRIWKLWCNISEARKKFEATADEGFLGKDMARFFNRVWNWVIKGIGGTVFIFVGHFVLTVLNTILSLVTVVGAPIWGVCWPVIHYLFDLLIFDTDAPSKLSPKWFPLINIILWRFGCKGVIQTLGAITAIVWNLVTGTTGTIWNGLTTSLRHIWDFFAYHLIVTRKGRIPIKEHATVFGLNVAKRVSGPGLASEYYYQINSDLALVMLKYSLEQKEVEAYRQMVKNLIAEPYCELMELSKKLTGSGLKLDTNGGPYQEVLENKNRLERKLDDAILEHWKQVPVRGNIGNINVRMTKAQLAETLKQATPYVQEFYIKRVFCFMNDEEVTGFWKKYQLNPDSWEELTRTLLKYAIHNNILVPIEDLDQAGFCLKTEDVNLKTYLDDIYSGQPRDIVIEEVPSYPWLTAETFPEGHSVVVGPDDLTHSNTRLLQIHYQQLKEYCDKKKKEQEEKEEREMRNQLNVNAVSDEIIEDVDAEKGEKYPLLPKTDRDEF